MTRRIVEAVLSIALAFMMVVLIDMLPHGWRVPTLIAMAFVGIGACIATQIRFRKKET